MTTNPKNRKATITKKTKAKRKRKTFCRYLDELHWRFWSTQRKEPEHANSGKTDDFE
jgi:hypothetical protein